MNTIDYKTLINQLEEKKWNMINSGLDLSKNADWYILQKRLERLYRWLSKNGRPVIKPFIPRILK